MSFRCAPAARSPTGAHERPGHAVAHQPIQTATTIALGEQGTERVLGYAELPLTRRITVTSLQYRHLSARGRTLALRRRAARPRGRTLRLQVTREDRYSIAYRDADVTVYENAGAYPRAFVVPEAVLAPDGPAAMARLRDGPLTRAARSWWRVRQSAASGRSRARRQPMRTIVAEGTAVLDLHADAPGGGFLVLTDPYYPGWRAFVNGVETPILRADYLFRAIALPPGSHEVRFAFAPWPLQRGAMLSMAGVVIALGAIAVGVVGALVSARPWRWLSVGAMSRRVHERHEVVASAPRADEGDPPPSSAPP